MLHTSLNAANHRNAAHQGTVFNNKQINGGT
jgi:hypothetical protein